MMQSPTYEILMEEIEKESKDKWMQQGLKQGLQQGLQQGMSQLLIETIEVKFGGIPIKLLKQINNIKDPEILRILHRKVIRCDSLEDFENILKEVLES